MATHQAHDGHAHGDAHHEPHGTVFQRIWRPFLILFAITALEFLIAFTVPYKGIKAPVFIAMTIVKAFYIVAYFMHVKFERVNLAYTIVLPFIFIVYLVILLLLEGDFIFKNLFG